MGGLVVYSLAKATRHRYYDSDSGQYLSSDPIGMAGGLRPQAYVTNPLEWVDPLGLAECPKGPNNESFLRSPATIRFSQDSVDGKFGNDQSINGLAAHLRADPNYISQVEPIRLVRFRDLPDNVQAKLGGQNVNPYSVFTIDKRRLLASRMAEVSVNSRWATQGEIEQFATLRRFSTTNGGGLPRIRK